MPFIFESMEADCDLVSVCPHVCHRCATLCPCGDPALTPPEKELHCHVVFGSDGQSGRGPDVAQPFPGSPEGNVTSSVKT